MYRLIVTRHVEHDLDKLSAKNFERVDRAIMGLASNPRPMGVMKLKTKKDTYRIRVGDYRIVYHINEKPQEVIILYVSLRENAY